MPHSCSVVVVVVDFLVTKTTPFAGNRGEQVSLVELDVLDRVTQADFVNSRAANSVSVHIDNGQFVNQLLCVGLMSDSRNL